MQRLYYIFSFIRVMGVCLVEYIFLCLYNKKRIFIERLTSQLIQINVLYVKVFQSIALNEEWLDAEMNEELLKMTDSVEFEEEEQDADALYSCIREFDLAFDSDSPIQSGMISIVYKMKRRETGESVVLKLKRKNIDEKMEKSMDELLFLVEILSYIPFFNMIGNISYMIQKNIASLKKQLDFEEEVRNIQESYENCLHMSYIKIPRVYPEVTQKYKHIIMMEWIGGQKIQDIPKEDYPIYAKNILKYSLISFFICGMIHGDLHAGNILFLKKDEEHEFQVGLIDFGIVVRIDKKIRDALLSCLVDFYTKPSHIVARNCLLHCFDHSVPIQEKHLNNMVDIGAKKIDAFHEKNGVAVQQLYDAMVELNNYTRLNMDNYSFKMDENIINTQLSLVMCNGVIMKLSDNKYMEIVEEVMNETFHLNLMI